MFDERILSAENYNELATCAEKAEGKLIAVEKSHDTVTKALEKAEAENVQLALTLNEELERNRCLRAENQRLTKDLSTCQERVRELEGILRDLTYAAEVYEADQGAAPDSRCGLTQPITVADGEYLQKALRVARQALSHDQPKEGDNTPENYPTPELEAQALQAEEEESGLEGE